MKKINLLAIGAIALSSLLFSCGNKGNDTAEETTTDSTAAEASYTVDAAASSVVWKGEMLGIKFHEGTIAIKEGTVSVAGTQVTGGTFTIDMASIKPTDTNYDKDNTIEKLVGHLSSADFFSVDSFPTASFTISAVEGNTATGTLSIRGISNEEKVTDITVVEEGTTVKINGKLTFDRKKYNVQWDAPVKEVVLSNDVPLNITLVANK